MKPLIATYTKKHEPEEEDDLMTVAEFRQCVASGGFIDYDGYGEAVKDGWVDPVLSIFPSEVDRIPADATHILWYNR